MFNFTFPLILKIDNIYMYIKFHVHILTSLPNNLLYPGIFILKFSYRTKYICYRKVRTKLFDANLHVYYILLCSDNKSVTNFSLTDNAINNVDHDIGCKLFTVILQLMCQYGKHPMICNNYYLKKTLINKSNTQIQDLKY